MSVGAGRNGDGSDVVDGEPAGWMSFSAVGVWPGTNLPLAAVLPAMNALDWLDAAVNDEVSPKIHRSRWLGSATLIPESRWSVVPVFDSWVVVTGPR